jgi:hypothetical protein
VLRKRTMEWSSGKDADGGVGNGDENGVPHLPWEVMPMQRVPLEWLPFIFYRGLAEIWVPSRYDPHNSDFLMMCNDPLPRGRARLRLAAL